MKIEAATMSLQGQTRRYADSDISARGLGDSGQINAVSGERADGEAPRPVPRPYA
jgi:hypothetical protein